MTSVLKAAARMRPLYLVLDDLHTSDPSSLALLHFVARNLRGLRALIVGAYRPEEAQVATEVGQALGGVAREGTFLPLVPLDGGQIADLVARFSGRPADAELVRSIERTRRAIRCSSTSCCACSSSGVTSGRPPGRRCRCPTP